ncbi:hypothetical protein OXX69_001565 [Metschnikowia pulcherrima]
MSIHIIIPEDANFYEHETSAGLNSETSKTAPHDIDWDAFYWSLSKASTRSVLFYDESFSGYIVHTCPIGERLPSENIYLQLNSMSGQPLDSNKSGHPARPDITIQPSTPAINVEQEQSKNKENENSVAVTELLWQGVSGSMSDPPVNVSIWRFNVSTGSPQKDTSGQLEMCVSFRNPQSSKSGGNGENINYASSPSGFTSQKESLSSEAHMDPYSHTENLLAELNHSISRKPTHKFELHYNKRIKDSKSHASPDESQRLTPHKPENSDITITNDEIVSQLKDLSLEPEHRFCTPTSAPLQLRLRTTKPGGRGNVLLTSLRIDAPDSLSAVSRTKRGKYVLHILDLHAEFKGGSITPLGHLAFPRRCEINEVLNLTYKLEKNESLGETKSFTEQNPAIGTNSKPVDITVRVRVEKQSNDDPAKWIHVTREISTTWTPILDFDNMTSPPNLPIKAQTPQGVSQAQFRSKSTYLKPPSSRKTVASKTFASTSTLPPSSSPYSPQAGWTSPNPMRPMASTKSTPLLSISRGGIVRKKPQRTVVSQQGVPSALTVNLGSDIPSVLHGLRLKFTGDPKINVGEIVTWQVQAVNRTKRVLKLVLMSSPVKAKTAVYSQAQIGNSTPNMSHQMLPPSHEGKGNQTRAFQNRWQLLERYNAVKPEKIGVVLLSNDVGLGVLEPNSVYESEFSFICFSKGVFDLSGLRLVEKTTGEVVEIGRLIEVYVM